MQRLNMIKVLMTLAAIALMLVGCKMEQSDQNSPPTVDTVPAVTTQPTLNEVNTEDLAPNRDRMGNYPRRLTDGKVTYKVTESRISGTKYLRIATQGLIGSNEELVLTVNGNVTHAELADLDGDGHSEILFFTQSYDDSKKGEAVGFASNDGVDMSEIRLPAATANPNTAKGYNGGDLYMIADDKVLHKYPIYDNGTPTGKYRTITYQLTSNNGKRIFEVINISEK